MSYAVITKNLTSLILAQILTTILGTASGILTARYFGDAGYGKYGFAVALVSFLQIFSDIGLSTLLITEVSKDKELVKKYLNNIFILKIFLSMFSLFLILLVLSFIDKTSEVKILVLLVASATLLDSLIAFLWASFRAFEVMQFEAVLSALRSIFLFVTIFIVIWLKGSLFSYAFFSIIASSIILIISIAVVRGKIWAFALEWDLLFWKKTLKQSVPLGLSTIFITIYYYIDTVMLSIIHHNDRVVGWYNASYKLVFIILALIGLYYTAVLPALSRFIHNKLSNEIQVLSKMTLRIITSLIFPLAFGTTLLASPIMLFIYGPSFVNGTGSLRILIWTSVAVGLNSLYGNILIASGKRAAYMFIVGIGSIINIILNVILIPPYSLVGAAIATVAAEIFILVVAVWNVKKSFPFIPIPSYFMKPLLSSLGMTVVLWYLSSLPVLLLILIGTTVYMLFLFLFRGISKSELLYLRRLI